MKSPILFYFLFCCSFGIAQVSLHAGFNGSFARSDVLKNNGFFYGYNAGVSSQFYITKKNENISVIIEARVNQKGYSVKTDEKKYDFGLSYVSATALFSYDFNKTISAQIGSEFNQLLWGTMNNAKDVFNEHDVGLVAGLTFFQSKKLSVQVRYFHGLTPTLDYYHFDELGNITGSFKDIYNTAISIGIKMKFRNEKFKLFR